MLTVVEDRGRFLRMHPLDVAIVVLTPPFLPATLQAAWVFRLLRVLRLVKAAFLLRRLFATEGIRDAAVFAAIVVVGGGAAYSAIEKGQQLSTWDGVWWAITTVTTVGYGDEYPRTTGGRLIAIAIMLVGIGFVAILTAAAADRFLRQRREDDEEHQAVMQRLDEISARLARLDDSYRNDLEP
jgi:voltage-gated potassium channel